nr:MAG TPA: hypothetical protein [Bacteriophage sp.]
MQNKYNRFVCRMELYLLSLRLEIIYNNTP